MTSSSHWDGARGVAPELLDWLDKAGKCLGPSWSSTARFPRWQSAQINQREASWGY